MYVFVFVVLFNSIQILLWANVTTESVCQQPYEWACGRFDEDYADNPLNGIYGGEWTAASSAEYEGKFGGRCKRYSSNVYQYKCPSTLY